jgi:hypothetical protein
MSREIELNWTTCSWMPIDPNEIVSTEVKIDDRTYTAKIDVSYPNGDNYRLQIFLSVQKSEGMTVQLINTFSDREFETFDFSVFVHHVIAVAKSRVETAIECFENEYLMSDIVVKKTGSTITRRDYGVDLTWTKNDYGYYVRVKTLTIFIIFPGAHSDELEYVWKIRQNYGEYKTLIQGKSPTLERAMGDCAYEISELFK